MTHLRKDGRMDGCMEHKARRHKRKDGWMVNGTQTKHADAVLCICLAVASFLERPGVCTVAKVVVFVRRPRQNAFVTDPAGPRLIAQVTLYKFTGAVARVCVPQVADFAFPASLHLRLTLEQLVLPSACPRPWPSHPDHRRRVENRYEKCAADGHP